MITVNCQSSIKLVDNKVIYFDPIKQSESHDADYIFITHTHWDHFSKEDIINVKKDSTIIIGPDDIEKECLEIGFSKDNIILVKPNSNISLSNIIVETFPAYNLNKKFHPKENNWLGYRITINGITYYIPGDTDVIPELDNLKVDVCFVPIGGTYTMTAEEAAKFINKIKPKKVIPIHYGMVVGKEEELLTFVNNVSKDIEIEQLIKL